MNTPNTLPDTYDESMQTAQVLHGTGNFDGALQHWQHAVGFVPPESADAARAWRGAAMSTYRGDILPPGGHASSYKTAMQFAGHSLAVYDQLYAAATTPNPEITREIIEGNRVLGVMVLRNTIQRELAEGRQDEGNYRDVIDHMAAARRAIVELRQQNGDVLDQHEINAWPHIAIAGSIAVPQQYARLRLPTSSQNELVTKARETAHLSEDPTLPTSAQLGRRGRAIAKGKAWVRATAAATIDSLATEDPGTMRTMALHAAMAPGVL